MNKLLKTSATQLAKMIREKKVSSEEVVRTYINQAKKVNPLINAIIFDRYEQALIEAKQVDEFLKGDPDKVPPFLGVPFTDKDMHPAKGMPCTWGLVHRKGLLAKEDCTAVARLKGAGAILIGVTNVPVCGLTFETTNKLYGRTNNPYNLDHNPGGSSGGEAAIVSSAGSAFGMGSDGGGSIRIPSNYCGIFGHKPSAHLIPNSGEYPMTLFNTKLGSNMIVLGPMTRFSEDLMPLVRIMAGPDGKFDYTEEMTLGDENKVKIAELKYYFMNHKGLHPDVQKAHDKAIEQLKSSGAQFSEINADLFKNAFKIMSSSFAKVADHDQEVALISDGKPIYLKLKYLREKFFGDSDLPSEIILLLIAAKIGFGAGMDKYIQLGAQLRNNLNQVLGDDGVLIFPVLAKPAIKHGALFGQLSTTWLTGIFNVAESASTAIPMGFSSEGLPVGFQAVARKGNDHLTIAVAKYFESQGFGWIPPKLAE